MANPILVVAEHLKGELSEVTFEMLGLGRRLADSTESPLLVALLGSEGAPLAVQLGMADSVLLVDDPQLNLPAAGTVAGVLKGLIAQKQVGLTLLGGTNLSMGVGSILSAQSSLPFVNFCRNARIEKDGFVATSQLFGGKIFTDVTLPGGRGILSIHPGSFAAEAGKSGKVPPVERVTVPVAPSAMVFTKFIEPEAGDVDITKQAVLVAVGRGIQAQDNLAMAEELAQTLGGAVCASRPVIDQGWLPLGRQVGKSGMTVKPRLYLAFGISGAPEHWEGMQSSQVIIAVNTDAKAPIFDGAHFGVCADALDLMPVLTEKVKAHKG